MNYGVCNKCKKRIPADHVIRDGKVYLHKECPDCGASEAMVSSDAAAWQRKRELYGYEPGASEGCGLNCQACGQQHSYRMAFLDVTNRCNMNCPICITNMPGMGFDFHPPLPYFEKIFDHLAAMDPMPVLHLFGGEPTVHENLFEIIDAALGRGLRVHLNTNGLKFEDEEFCKRICEKEVSVLFSFDGSDPAIYDKLRSVPSAAARKLKGLENRRKHSRRRQNILMCVMARHVNDQHIAGIFTLCHEHRSHVKGLYFLPLTETWEPGRFEVDITTTMEDTEQIVDEAFPPDEKVTYLSLGLQHHLGPSLAMFGDGARQTFTAIHPNCESGTRFYSDGERYRPLGYYLPRPLDELAGEMVQRAKAIEPKLARLDPSRASHRLRGRWLVLRTLGTLVLKAMNFRRVFKGHPWITLPRFLGGLLLGRSLRDQFARHSRLRERLDSIILPFEEPHSLESERLARCAAAFAYEDPESGEVKLVPGCSWPLYNREILRALAKKYGTD